MRFTLFSILFISSAFISLTASAAGNNSADLSSPPYWMFSYDEFSDLRKSQKDFYIKNFVRQAKKLPGLEKLSQEKMEDAVEWRQSWNEIEKTIDLLCKNSRLARDCEKIAEVRLNTLDLFSNQKLENRK